MNQIIKKKIYVEIVKKMEDIKEQFRQVITYSQNIPDPQVDGLFEQWEENKKPIIDALGGELIYTYPEKVSFELNKQSQENLVSDFIKNLDSCYENFDLTDFISDMKDCFFNNLTSHNYVTADGKLIKRGTKLVKAFKYFENNKEALNNIQSYASRIIQENKIEGYLCLSVHPLDFLSISENTHNWRSCHALDGSYRSGNLSYMADKSTIVCYLRSEHDEKLPNFPFEWNNKKWRVLLYLSDDWNMMFAGRQYPFSSDNGIKFILEQLIPASGLTKGYTWTNWHDEKIKSFGNHLDLDEPFYPVGSKLIGKRTLIRDNPGALQYNDLLYSTCYEPIYAFKRSSRKFFDDEWGLSNYKTSRFHIGEAVSCLDCGKKRIGVKSIMRCLKCEVDHGDTVNDDFGYCQCCGRHIFIEDGCWVGDDLVCDRCIEIETTQCDKCGSIVYNSDIVYDRKSNKFLCRRCHEEE